MVKEHVFVKEFKEAYEKYYGETITEKEAHEKFFRLVNILRTIIYGEPGDSGGPQPFDPSHFEESKLSDNLED